MASADSYFHIECYCVHVCWQKYVADMLGVAYYIRLSSAVRKQSKELVCSVVAAYVTCWDFIQTCSLLNNIVPNEPQLAQ